MELLAPGGSYNSFIASINAGADAIYLGGKSFSARMYSSNFTNEEIASLIKYAHVRDVKVYVTINTLLFEDEFFDAVSFATFLYENDVDGILIQDLGFAHYLHKTMPDLVLHASTQLNCHNLAQAKALKEIGFKRIVLAREVSLEEAKKIKELGVEVEVFVHGALCVSYSGNCLMSSFIGGRSGNRGRCAQPCRHHNCIVYKDEELTNYAISTKDLQTLEYIKKYQEIGIDSLKIEGRMKREEYVYQVVSSYRKAIDEKDVSFYLEEDKIKRLFNREFTKGYILDESRTKVLNQDVPSNLGVRLGRVVEVKNNFIYMLLEDNVHVGDGIKFLNEDLDGMLLTRFSINKDFVKSAKKGDIISFSRNNLNIKRGTLVNKTTDYLLNEELQNKMNIKKLIPLELTISGKINKPLIISLKDGKGNEIEYQSDFTLEEVKKNPTSKERIIEQMRKVDDAPFYFSKVNYLIEDEVFVPISLLNAARRIALEMITKKRENYNHYSLRIKPYSISLEESNTSLKLMQVENLDQYLLIKDKGYLTVTNKEKGVSSDYIFNKRIDHLDESELQDGEITSYYKERKDGFNILSCYGNVTNSYTLDFYFEKGYKLVFYSLECSKRQILMISEAFRRRHGFYPNVGIHLYGHIDYMIMKSCPLASAHKLSKDHCNLCKKNPYYLKDHLNVTFPILTNEDCTTRILSNRPVSLISKMDELEGLHINNYIVSFTIENVSQMEKVIASLEAKTSVSSKDFFGHYINEVE